MAGPLGSHVQRHEHGRVKVIGQGVDESTQCFDASGRGADDDQTARPHTSVLHLTLGAEQAIRGPADMTHVRQVWIAAPSKDAATVLASGRGSG